MGIENRIQALEEKRNKIEKVFQSDEILQADELCELQGLYCSEKIRFKYKLTEAELYWLHHMIEKMKGVCTSVAEWIVDRMDDDGIVTFDDAESMSIALDNDWKGQGKAVILSDDTALQRLLFWMYQDASNIEEGHDWT